jgi:hypothetical protein
MIQLARFQVPAETSGNKADFRMLHREFWQTFTDISEVITAFIILAMTTDAK